MDDTPMERLLTSLTGPNPPLDRKSCAERAGVSLPALNGYIATLLRNGHITAAQIPWRRFDYSKPDLTTTEELRKIIREGGRDRVIAIKLLTDLEVASGGRSEPPMPNSHAETLAAAVRLLQSIGRETAYEALQTAFPAENPAVEPEAPLAQDPAPSLDPPAETPD